jgi:hypothetical protein
LGSFCKKYIFRRKLPPGCGLTNRGDAETRRLKEGLRLTPMNAARWHLDICILRKNSRPGNKENETVSF